MYFVPIYAEIHNRPLSHRASCPDPWDHIQIPHMQCVGLCAYTRTYTPTHPNPRHKKKNLTLIYLSVKNQNPHQKQMLFISLFLLLLLASTCSPRTATSWARVPPAFLLDPSAMPRGQERDTTLHMPLEKKQCQKFCFGSASAHKCTKPRSSRSADKQNERLTDKQVGLCTGDIFFIKFEKRIPLRYRVPSHQASKTRMRRKKCCNVPSNESFQIYMLLYLAYRCTALAPIYPAQVIAKSLPVFFWRFRTLTHATRRKLTIIFPCQTLARKVSTTVTLKVFENRGDLSNINKCSKIRLYCSRKHTSVRSWFSVVSRRSRLKLSDQFILRPDSQRQERTVKASIPVLEIHK